MPKAMSFIEKVKATQKSRETEGPFELYVTRTPGYLWAQFFRVLHVHPIAVTLLSILLGALSGPCFYPGTLDWTLLGILLLVWANWYDCADGQLARMTNKRTLIGRILDGFAGDVWFFSIYFFICLRLTPELIPFTNIEWGYIIWLLCAWAGFICHGRQCAISDYYRNIHMWVELGSKCCELDTTSEVSARYKTLRWFSKDWFEKLYLYFYRHYCDGQEKQTPEFQKLYAEVCTHWGGNLPDPIKSEFRTLSKPLMPTTNLLTFDFRVGVLFVSLLIAHPWIYPIIELTLMEYWRYNMRKKHETFSRNFTIRLITLRQQR